MNNYNAMQGILNSNTNPYYAPYMQPLFPDAYQNGMFNQNEVPMTIPMPNPGFQDINPPVGQNLMVEEAVVQHATPPAEPEQAKPKPKRRSKNEKNGRDHKCGCGKTYLSYPALYTHIKTKHGGKNPNGIDQQPSSRTRGRPKKVLISNMNYRLILQYLESWKKLLKRVTLK